MAKDKLKIVHLPFSGRNPYQKLLSEYLINEDLEVQGSKVKHVLNISFLNLSIIFLIFQHWKPDIIHLHWQSSFLNVDGSRFKTIVKSLLFIAQIWIVKRIGVKFVWTVHNLKRHEETFRDLESLFTRILAKLTNQIIVHCQSANNIVQRQCGHKIKNKIAVIPHGHFLNYYENRITRENARNKLNIDGSKLTFLFLGELRYYKGILDLVDAFKLLKNPNSQLLIAGRPHNMKIRNEIIQKTCQSNNITTHLVFVPEKEIQTYINACDVMVFPYRDIFTSGGIFLALSFGKPIVAPGLGCLVDTLKDTPNFLYDARSQNGLLETLKTVIDSKDDIDKIGQHNLNLTNRFGWKDIAQKTLHAYQKSLQN